MTPQWLIYFLIFASVFLAFQGVRGFLSGRAENRRTAQRFSAIDGFAGHREEVELLKKRSSGATRTDALAGAQALLLQSGTNLTPARLGVTFAVMAALLYWPASKYLGFVPGIGISALVPAALLLLFLRRKRSKRIAKFGEQLPDVLEVIIRSLKAGHPLPVSVSLVGREMPSPAGPEFTMVFDEISYGREIRGALENLMDRVGHPDINFLITSVGIAHQTGGNLGEILARLSKLMRERFRMKRKIKSLSAEGRYGGYFLSVVPALIFLAVLATTPTYYGEFWGHPTQNKMLAVAGIMLLIGNFMIYKLVNFKV